MNDRIVLKASWELDLLRRSNRLVAETLAALSERVKPGVTTLELDRFAESSLVGRGAKPAFVLGADNLDLGQALQALYDFFWHEFCDVYLEASKAQLTDPKRKEQTRRILLHVLANSLKLLHPFTPFITEEIYSHLPIKDKTMLIVENWPK